MKVEINEDRLGALYALERRKAVKIPRPKSEVKREAIQRFKSFVVMCPNGKRPWISAAKFARFVGVDIKTAQQWFPIWHEMGLVKARFRGMVYEMRATGAALAGRN